MKPKSVFWSGFLCGWCSGLISLALLIGIAGCTAMPPAVTEQPKPQPAPVVTYRLARQDSLIAATVEASARAAAHADSVTAEQPMAASKVAAVMAANDITLPQVAAFLSEHGFDVINLAEFREWTWTPAPAGTYPVAYYVANFRVATGSNSLRVYLPQTAGPYWIRVKAYDGQGNSGPWSMTSTSAAGDLLPGVTE